VTVIKTWTIDYKQKFGKTPVPTTTAIEGPDTPEEAKLAFIRKNPDAKGVKVRAGTSHCESYEELVEWLKSREVSPRETQGGVQVMVLNPRKPREPWPCECGFDLNDGVDHVGNAYYCPKCHTLIQTG
jgi:hypothetical protein